MPSLKVDLIPFCLPYPISSLKKRCLLPVNDNNIFSRVHNCIWFPHFFIQFLSYGFTFNNSYPISYSVFNICKSIFIIYSFQKVLHHSLLFLCINCGWLNFRGFRGGSDPRNLVPKKKGFSVWNMNSRKMLWPQISKSKSDCVIFDFLKICTQENKAIHSILNFH